MHKFLFPRIHGPDHDLCIKFIGQPCMNIVRSATGFYAGIICIGSRMFISFRVSNSDLIAVTAGIMSNVSSLCLLVLSLSKADLFLKRSWTSSAR